ncbi:MAG: hypothetical protein WB760_13630 [Xanthobacteraceae bacterium]
MSKRTSKKNGPGGRSRSTANYIAEMTRGLAQLARADQCDALADMLDRVSNEAEITACSQTDSNETD